MNQHNDKKIFIQNTLNIAHKTIYNLIVLIFFSFIKYIKCQKSIFNLTCKYPHYFQLNNGYNLLCCSKGIYTYDFSFNQMLFNHTFDTEINSETEAQYIVIEQFSEDEGGNVIVLDQNNFYYLNNEGKFIFDSNISLIHNNNNFFHYTLVPYKYNNDYYFIVGMFNSSSQVFLYNYKINSFDKVITKIEEIKPYIKPPNAWSGPSLTYGIECKKMKSNKYENILVCFFVEVTKGKIMVYSFDINNNLGIIDELSERENFYKPKYFEVAVSQNKSLALMCYRAMNNQKGNCTSFDTNSGNFSEPEQYIINCGDKSYNTKITYVKTTQEYIFSCINSQSIRLAKFDKNMNLIYTENNDDFSYNNIEANTNFHNIIYLNQYNNYILFYDTENGNESKFILLPDKYNPDISFLPSTIKKIPQAQTTSLSNPVSIPNDISIINTKISTISKPKIPFNPPIPQSPSSLNSISTTLLNEKYTTSPISISTTLINKQSTSSPNPISTTLLNEKSTTLTSLINKQSTSSINPISTTLINEKSNTLTTLINKQSTSSINPISTTLINEKYTTSPNSILTTLIDVQSTSSLNIISTTLLNEQSSSSPNSISNTIVQTKHTTFPNLISTTLINTQSTSFLKGQNSLTETQPTSSPNTIPSSLISIQFTFSQSSTPTTLIKAQTTYISSSTTISPSFSMSTLFSTHLLSSSFLSESISLNNPESLNFPSNSLTSFNTYSSNSLFTSSSNIISSNIISIDDNKTICDAHYFYKNILTNKCQKECNYDEFINEICYIFDLNENNILNVTQDIRNIIKSLNINKNTNLVVKGNNALYQIISSEAMTQNKNKSISIIDFSKCEEILKNEEKIDYILILKVDIHLSNSTNIVLKYEVYNPYTLKKLDLSICNKVKINTLIPYSLTGKYVDLYSELNELGYDLNNPNDSFYNDICCPFTTENKTDILLYDRKMNYYKNTTFCEEGCTYKEYDYIEGRVKCECLIKTDFDGNIDNIQFYSNLVLNTFFKIDHFSNIIVLKCYKLVFSKLGLDKNYGSCIFLFILAVYIILMIFFYLNFKSEVLRIFNTIIEKKYKNSVSSPIKNKYNRKAKKHSSCMISKDKIAELVRGKIMSNDNLKIHKKHQKSKFDRLNFKIKKERKNSINNSSKEIFNSKNKSNTFSVSDKIFKFNNKMSTLKNDIINHKSKNKNKIKKIKSLLYKFSNDELNSLKYEDAIEFDKRTYFEYYMSLIRQKQLIIFSFFNKNDYNLFSIKLSLFLFSFSLYFTVNTLFFTDETMHKIYENQGLLEYYFYLLHIIYSTFISAFITLILKMLALSNKNMLKIKRIKGKRNALMESVKLIKELNVRFNIYYIISFVLLIFFWYFISAFCAVYKNTQIILFENTLSSFALSLLYPFGLYLLPGMFRIPALRAKSKDKKCLYVFSNLLSYI